MLCSVANQCILLKFSCNILCHNLKMLWLRRLPCRSTQRRWMVGFCKANMRIKNHAITCHADNTQASTAGGFDDAVTAINKVLVHFVSVLACINSHTLQLASQEMDALFGMANSATVSDAAHQIPLQTTGRCMHCSIFHMYFACLMPHPHPQAPTSTHQPTHHPQTRPLILPHSLI